MTNYLLRHRVTAVLLTFAITFVPVIGVIGILYAGMVTLRKGIANGSVLLIAATVPYAISFYFSSNGADPSTQLMLWAAVGVAVLSNVLTWVFAVMLRKQATWSQILQVAALMGVLVVSVVHLVYPDVANWWGNQLQSYYKQATQLTGALNATDVKAAPSDTQLESINATKEYATGLMTAAVLFNALLQLVVSRWWQAIVFSPGMLRRELHNIRLSQLATVLFAASLILAYLGNSVVLDMMPIMYLLFAAAGLSLIHYLFGLMKSSTRWFWLWLMYVTLIFAVPMSVMMVALVALFDVWLDVRHRLKTS